MNYITIEEYLQENNYFNQPVNELWIVDNVAIKSIEVKNLLPNHFHPKILQVDEVFNLLKEFFLASEKVVINSFEKELLIKKIISDPTNLDKFKKLENNLDNLISCLDNIRLYPSYQKRFKLLENNNNSVLLKDLIEDLLALYQLECKKNNFIDDIDIKIHLSEIKNFTFTKYDRIVIYGNLFAMPELGWKILQNYCSSNTNEIIFVGSTSKIIKFFFQDNNFMEFQDTVKNYFYSDQEISWENQLKNLSPEKIILTKFADWDEELNFIAREIKKDILENNLLPEELAIYIPKEDLYSFKVEKTLKDFELPFQKSYSLKLSRVPLGNFFRWLLKIDFNSVSDCLKLLKSAFTTINFNDFSIPSGELINFNGNQLKSNTIKLDFFDLSWLEKVLSSSGISHFKQEEENFKKLEENFKRKIKYELNKNNEDDKKFEQEFLKSYYFLKYFNDKVNFISSLLPKLFTPEEFKNSIFSFLKEIKVDQRFLNINSDRKGYYTNAYSALTSMIQDTTTALSRMENRSYGIEEYYDIFNKQLENTFFKEDESSEGIIITELAYISKISLKRVYQVGMTNTHFPTNSGKNAFNIFMELFKPVQVRETQLAAFAELINKTTQLKDFKLYLSYPVIINNQEDEPSDVFSDLAMVLPEGTLKFKSQKYIAQEKIYSISEKAEAIAKDRFPITEDIKKLLHISQKRNNLAEWSEYEGYLNMSNESLSKGYTSISQIEEFAKCPMKYYFHYKLNLKKTAKTFKDIDATLKGTLIHKILEVYYTEAQGKDFFKNKELLSQESRSLILKITNDNFKTYEESLNNLYIDKLKDQFIAGLEKGDQRNGILVELLKSDQERLLEGKIPAHFEYDFEHEIHGMKFKGVIDRVDNYEDDKLFDVIDYKTGTSFDPSKKKKELKEGLSFQLTVYSEAYAAQHNKKLNEGGYYVLNKVEKDDKIAFSPVLCKDGEEEENQLKEKLKKNLEHLETLKEKLVNSEYRYTMLEQEEACKFCDFKTICRYNESKAETFKPKKGSTRNLSLDFIKPEIFSFPENTVNDELGLTDDQKQALDFNRNIIVTAGAGAGKTATLTQRMFGLLKETNGDIEKILVVTFTKKATAEMQNRIYQYINKNVSISGLEENSFIKKAKLNFKKNWISTIDAFYLRLLKENILELDIDAELDVSDEKDLLVLINDTVEKKIDQLAGLRDKNLSLLLEAWNRSALITLATKLIHIDWIDNFLNTELFDLHNKYQEAYIKQANVYLKSLDEFGSKIPQNHENIKIKKFFDVAFELISFYKVELSKFISNSADFKYHNIYEKVNPKTNKKIAFRFPRLKDEEKEILDGLNDEIIEELRPTGKEVCEISNFLFLCQYISLEKENLFSLIELLKQVKAEYDRVKKERRIFTFSDIALKLFELLRDNPKARTKLAAKFDYIMIDEFQDTNAYQYDIAKYLAGWDGKTTSSINKNKLFFVGDEKQAIYQFRGGDVQVFNTAKKEVNDVNLMNKLASGHVIFRHNFRSGKNLVNFFNQFFNEVFAPANLSGKKIYEADHQNLISSKEQGSVNFLLINKGEKLLKELRQNTDLEAKIIATVIKKILADKPNEEIAVLFRTRKRIPLFADALEKSGINYVIYGGTGFYENQEIVDLLNILIYITNEKRILEFAGFLRSPMGALSDKEILNLKLNLKKGLKENHPSLYGKIFGTWENGKLMEKGWKQLSCELKTYQLVEKILNDTFYKFANHLESGSRQKLKNLERFIEIAKDKDDHTLEEFIEFIEFQIEHEIDESNSTIIDVGEIKPVQLMTIHKAKGLGFNTVIIADAAAESFKPHTESIHTGDLEILHSDEILNSFVGFKIKDTAQNFEVKTYIKQTILELIKNKEEAELKRLMYVAMTRAKNNLIVSASCWNGLFQMGKKAMTMFRFMMNYFNDVNEDGSLSLLEDLVLMSPSNNVLEPEVVEKQLIKGIPFYIFNDSYDINLENISLDLSTEPTSMVDKINHIRKPIFAYSNIKDKPDIIRQLINNFDDSKYSVFANPEKDINKIDYPTHFYNLEKSELERLAKHRGNMIHKLLEHRVTSHDIARNILMKELPAELVENSMKHFINLRTILDKISGSIISDYHELPFLSGQLTGIFDKLVKTNQGWEIWDYKVSDAHLSEKVIKEAQIDYKVQYLIYTQQLSKLLALKEVKYKLIFSNFGVVEIVS